jgi:hypothetical protein
MRQSAAYYGIVFYVVISFYIMTYDSQYVKRLIDDYKKPNKVAATGVEGFSRQDNRKLGGSG